MNPVYLDTSVIVKLFTWERDSEYYGKLVDGRHVSSSIIAYTEVWSALLQKERAKSIRRDQRSKAWNAFNRQVLDQALELRPLGAAGFKRANRILESCHERIPLRSLDALHLAACDQAQDWPLATADNRMREAAAFLNFPLTSEAPT